VYSKNQQFRLFNCIKYGKTNPFITSYTFPFDKHVQYTFFDLLQMSLISLNEDEQISKIYFKEKKFVFNSSINSCSNSIITAYQNLNLINQFLENLSFTNTHIKTNTEQNASQLCHHHNFNNKHLSEQQIQKFTPFVESIIKSYPSHQGYIRSCLRGNYNKNLLFYNIGGNYRYCPKKNDHHQNNTVAIMINTLNSTYCIHCKDIECDNSITIWKKIN